MTQVWTIIRRVAGLRRPAWLYVVIGIVACLAGCGEGPSYPAARVAGEITIDGEPLPTGYIQFTPQEKGPTVGAPIVDGQYDAPHVPLGMVQVNFWARKETGRMEKDPDSDQLAPELTDAIPPAFRSGFKIDVRGDTEEQDFQMTSE
jgi:hypothetical protein